MNDKVIKKVTKEQSDAVHNAIIYMLRHDPFYGFLTREMKVHYDFDLPAEAGVNITNTINLYVNPELFIKVPIELRVDIIKHECLHLICDHIARAKNLDVKIGDKAQFNHMALNIAMDCAINQLGLKEIYNSKITIQDENGNEVEKDKYVTLESFREMMGLDRNDASIQAKQTFEYYFSKMKENAQQLMDKYGQGMEGLDGMDSVDDHGKMGEEGEIGNKLSDEYKKEVLKQAIKESESEAKKQGNGRGMISSDVALMIEELFKSKINWKRELRIFTQKTISAKKRLTRKKPNRRFGLTFQGKKKEYQSHIAFIVDTSGSMSDKALTQGWSEMIAIHKTKPYMKITFIEADSEVNDIREFNAKLKPEIKGRGGTAYQPAIDKAVELGVSGIVYFGDMDAFDTPNDPKIPFLWVGVGSQKPPATFGKHVYMEDM